MKGRVLVAGFATRHIAQSAHAAGYEVYAVDHFCDQDLGFYTREAKPFAELSDLEGAVVEMCERHSPDFIVAASGASPFNTNTSACVGSVTSVYPASESAVFTPPSSPA